MPKFYLKLGGALSLISALTLAACGGDSAVAPAAPVGPTVSGVAATGAAIASGTVSLKCVSGTTTASITGADGSFSIDVSGVTFPCVGRVDYTDSAKVAQKLHTFISAAGTANITPITDLLVAKLTNGASAAAFDSFNAATVRTYDATAVKTASDAVRTYLGTTLSVSITNLPADLVATKFVAKTGSTPGDAADVVLDDLAAKLKAQSLTVVTAGAALSGGTGGTGGTGASPTSSLASKMSASLAGTYVVRCAAAGGGTVDRTVVIKVDGSSTLDGTPVVDSNNTGEVIVSNRIAHSFAAFRQAGTTFSPSFLLQFMPTNGNAIDTTQSSQVNNVVCSGVSGAASAPVDYAGIIGSYARTGTLTCPASTVAGVPSGATSYTVAANGTVTLGTTILTPASYRDGTFNTIFDDAATYSQFRNSAIAYQRLRVGQFSNSTSVTTSLDLVLDPSGATRSVDYAIKGESGSCKP